jgi:hypothetical protein
MACCSGGHSHHRDDQQIAAHAKTLRLHRLFCGQHLRRCACPPTWVIRSRRSYAGMGYEPCRQTIAAQRRRSWAMSQPTIPGSPRRRSRRGGAGAPVPRILWPWSLGDARRALLGKPLPGHAPSSGCGPRIAARVAVVPRVCPTGHGLLDWVDDNLPPHTARQRKRTSVWTDERRT